MNETLTLEAVRKTVTVGCDVEEAFRVFTTELTSWWPTDSHSIHGKIVTEVVLEPREGGAVYEIAEDGRRGHWATVLVWEPPRRIVLSWEVASEVVGTEVEVRFAEQGPGATRVDLEHRGWDTVHAEKRASYESGWDFVLGRYVDRLA